MDAQIHAEKIEREQRVKRKKKAQTLGFTIGKFHGMPTAVTLRVYKKNCG